MILNYSAYLVGFVVVLVFAAALRFYQLAQVPHGMTWDEAAIGYNGYAVLTTRRDEWLDKIPISFQSFGDYKAPFAIYLNGFFTLLLGMNLLAVRFPFAVAGVVSVALFMLLTKKLFEYMGETKRANFFSLIAGVMMAFSPWHLHFSRVGFESGLALMFVLFGVWSLLEWWTGNRKYELMWSTGALLSFVLALYTYHSAKIFLPLFALTLAFLFRREWWQRRKLVVLDIVAGLMLLGPLVADSFFSSGNERLSQSSLFGLKLPMSELLLQITQHFFRHFSLDYLVMGATTTLRHGDGRWGVLYATTLFLVLCGVGFGLRRLLRSRSSWSSKKWQIFVISILWIVIGTLPAAIGRDVPHSNRALLALPGFFLLAILGLGELLDVLLVSQLNKKLSGTKGEKDLLVKSVLGGLVLAHAVLVCSYLHNYYTNFSAQSTNDFNDGYLEAMKIAKESEATVEKILFTDKYGQPYIYALFARRTNPIWYRGGSLIKYEFSNRINVGDFSRSNTLIIASPDQIEPSKGQKLILGADGSVRFVVVKTP